MLYFRSKRRGRFAALKLETQKRSPSVQLSKLKDQFSWELADVVKKKSKLWTDAADKKDASKKAAYLFVKPRDPKSEKEKKVSNFLSKHQVYQIHIEHALIEFGKSIKL